MKNRTDFLSKIKNWENPSLSKNRFLWKLFNKFLIHNVIYKKEYEMINIWHKILPFYGQFMFYVIFILYHFHFKGGQFWWIFLSVLICILYLSVYYYYIFCHQIYKIIMISIYVQHPPPPCNLWWPGLTNVI